MPPDRELGILHSRQKKDEEPAEGEFFDQILWEDGLTNRSSAAETSDESPMMGQSACIAASQDVPPASKYLVTADPPAAHETIGSVFHSIKLPYLIHESDRLLP